MNDWFLFKRKKNEDLIDIHGDCEAWIQKVLFTILILDCIQFVSLVLLISTQTQKSIRYSVSNWGLMLLRAKDEQNICAFHGKNARRRTVTGGPQCIEENF